MCIIAIKPKDKELQNKEVLERCFTSNRDGAGYMYVDTNGSVIIKKGFMKFDEFYKSVTTDYKELNLKDKNLVMHFRIGTSGKNKEGCTHPFPITNKMNELEYTSCKTNIGICHNGIVSNFNSYTAQHSDTELYIATVLTPIIKLNLQAYKFADVQELILKTTNSKWTILDKNDELYTIGNFVINDGYMYSNESYKPIVHLPINTYKYDKYDDDDDLNEQSKWYHKAYEKQKNTVEKTTTEYNKYKALKTGNICCADAIQPAYTKLLEYFKIQQNDKYYYDNKYNIYIRTNVNGNDYFSMIGVGALIYTNETFAQRRDFND